LCKKLAVNLVLSALQWVGNLTKKEMNMQTLFNQPSRRRWSAASAASIALVRAATPAGAQIMSNRHCL
jgi:hypothetical protein